MEEQNEVSITLSDLWKVFKNNLIIIISATIIGAIVAFLIAQFAISPKYEATSKMYISTNDGSIISLSDLQTSAALTDDYEVIVKGRNFVDHAFKLLTSASFTTSTSADKANTYTTNDLGNVYIVTDTSGNKTSYSIVDLIALLTINNPSNSHILEIKVQSSNPLFSADFANALAAITQDEICDIIPISDPVVFEEAIPNTTATSPNKKLYILVGALIGLVGAYGICFLIYVFKSSFDNEDDVTRVLGIDTLGVISDGETLGTSDSSNGGTK